MSNPFRFIMLKKEAHLFDAKEYLLKTFIAVSLAYAIGKSSDYISKDMISLLFGMIMTLEPINLSGMRSGFKQVEASIIGALITGIIISVFGLNLLTTSAAITATLYVALLINWREVSVVAVFTSIYMTQYIQFTPDGDPSQWLTFKLRIVALVTGVLIALLINFIFSRFGYRRIYEKRLYHVVLELVAKNNAMLSTFTNQDKEKTIQLMSDFPGLFNTLDWIFLTINDSRKDFLLSKNHPHRLRLDYAQKSAALLRDAIHLHYDLCYQVKSGSDIYKDPQFIDSFAQVSYILSIYSLKLKQQLDRKEIAETESFQSLESPYISVNQLYRCVLELLEIA